MTERAKLSQSRSGLPVPGSAFPFLVRVLVRVLVLGSLFAVGCRESRWAYGVYAHDTRALVRLDYDYNADGVIDVRTYMRSGRPIRLEGDADGDGLVDRWEYYDARGELLRIGSSTAHDGIEDTWARVAGDERIVELSTARDGLIDRRETYRDTVLVRTETDTNRDGLADTWEEFENGALVRLLLDEEKRHGRPTRRLVYAGDGAARVELIPTPGSGTSPAPIDLEKGLAPR